MLDLLTYLVMVPLVYIAMLWALAGSLIQVVRLLRTPRAGAGTRVHPVPSRPVLRALSETFTFPSVRRASPLLWGMLTLFHLGLLLLFLGHLDLFPGIHFMPEDSPHMLGWGAVGVVVTGSVLYLLVRRFASPLREVSVPADFLLLFLLFLLFLSGDIISWGNSWTATGFLITKQDVGIYFGQLASLGLADPAGYLHPVHYHMLAIHVLLAEVFLFVLPFSRVMHTIFAIPLNLMRRV